MSAVLGFEFYKGDEVPAPEPMDFTLSDDEVTRRRKLWADAIDQAIRDEDAWGMLAVRPNCDVLLFDVDGAYKATGVAAEIHLLLAKEAKR